MDLEHKAIERLKYASETSLAHYEKPLLITYSGGKDSDVLLELALRAEIPIEVIHNHTTADAPQTVHYVRQRLYNNLELRGVPVSVVYPLYKGKRESLWSLIPVLGAPNIFSRWCCKICKEQSGDGRAIATGVRWAESARRKNTRGPMETITRDKQDKIILFDDTENEQMVLSDMVIINGDNDERRRWTEHCQVRGEICFNPIIEWENSDVWAFLAGREVNPLYQMGFDRVGCIGCPQANKKRYHDFHIFPAYKKMWQRALEKRLERRKAQGKANTGVWKNIDTYWAWWMNENPDQLFVEEWET